MDSNQEESLDFHGLQALMYTDPPSQSSHFDKPQDVDPSSGVSYFTGMRDESFNREIDNDSVTSAGTNNNNREPLIPTDPIEPREEQDQRTSPTVVMERSPNARQSNATPFNDTGVDKTGTLQLGYSPSKQDDLGLDDPTQRDSDSYNERLRQRVGGGESLDHLINFDNDVENADTQPVIDDDDEEIEVDEIRTQEEELVTFFDESRRFETPASKKRKTGPGDDEQNLPLADLGDNDMPLGLTQMFNASSPVRNFRALSPRNNTSPAVVFANKQWLPNYPADGSSPPAPASLGIRKIVTEPAADYVSLQESQERRKGRKKAFTEADKSDDVDDHDPFRARWERERRERHREKTVEEQLRNIKAPARPNAVRYGRKPKDKTKSSSRTNSPVNVRDTPTKSPNNRKVIEPIEIMDDTEEEVEEEEHVEESTVDIREIEEPTQVDEEEIEPSEIQVPSTAKKATRKTLNVLPSDDTPLRAAKVNGATDAVEEFVSNSQADTQSAVSDSQQSLVKEVPSSSLRATSQRRGKPTPKTIHDFSTGDREDILAMVGPLTSSVPRGNDKTQLHPESLVPESSSPPRAVNKEKDAPPSSPPQAALSGRSTRRTLFQTRQVGGAEAEPAATTPKVLRSRKTLTAPPSSRHSVKDSMQEKNLRTPYPEKGIPAVQPTTIPETSPAFRYDESPAPALRSYFPTNQIIPRRRSKDAAVEIPCSLTEDPRPASKAQSSDEPVPEPVRNVSTFPQGRKRFAPVAEFSVPITKKRLRRNTFQEKVVADSYDVSKHQQLLTSSENGFSSPPPDLNEQEEGPTPASPPISSPAPSAEIPITKGFAASGSIVEESSLDADQRATRTTPRKRPAESCLLRGPGKRVFAQFKGGNHAFYPATLVVDAVIAVATEIGVKFDDGTATSLSKFKVRRLDLQKGDIVKVDRTGLKQKMWLVEGVKKSGEKTELTDMHGNDVVVLKQKPTGKKAVAKDDSEIEVKVTEVYITSTQWPQFNSRYVPFEAAGRTTSPALSRSPTATPTGGKAQLRTPPTANYSNDMTAVSATAGPLTSGGLFSGMIFAISYGDKEAEKKVLRHKIEANGGKVVEEGFVDLFSQPAKAGKFDVSLIEGVERWGFACVLSEKHSRTPKYLQALALGLPCLAGRWVDACMKKRKIIPWEDYLLPAGESQHLNNAIKSRILTPVPAKEARFIEMYHDRKKVFEGYKVLYVIGTGKVEERRKTHLFLVHVCGASSLERVASLEVACERLRKVKSASSSTPADLKYMIVTKSYEGLRASREQMQLVKSKHAVLMDDEWVIQSLIMGRLLEPDDT